MAKAKSQELLAGSDKKLTKPDKGQVQESLLKGADWLAKMAAAVFFIATSYAFVAQWLKTHQTEQNMSTAGAILLISVALFLFVRKR